MRILVLWPPSVPSYFNAGHHLGLWEVAGHLRDLPEVSEVQILDAGVLNATWAAVARRLREKPDVIAIMNDFDTVPALHMLASYARSLSPDSRLVSFGRASSNTPGFFRRYGLDAIVADGDWETGVADFVRLCAGELEAGQVSGLLLRELDGGYRGTAPGRQLAAEDWAWPDPAEVPWERYNALYVNDALRFSGLPQQRELPVTIARGCPIGCHYCLVAGYQGRRERRRSVDSIMAYVDRVRAVYPFDYLATHAPSFTLRRDWVLAFAAAVEAHPDRFAWKTCTNLHQLDRELIAALAASRCLRISVGLESLDPQALAGLPRVKQTGEAQLRQVAGWCREYGIELNCLVMLGMPGETRAGLDHTLAVVRELGLRLRPTLYTPFERLHEDMDEHQFVLQTRQLVQDPGLGADQREHLYAIQYPL